MNASSGVMRTAPPPTLWFGRWSACGVACAMHLTSRETQTTPTCEMRELVNSSWPAANTPRPDMPRKSPGLARATSAATEMPNERTAICM